jgi:hypothetical protein
MNRAAASSSEPLHEDELREWLIETISAEDCAA